MNTLHVTSKYAVILKRIKIKSIQFQYAIKEKNVAEDISVCVKMDYIKTAYKQ